MTGKLLEIRAFEFDALAPPPMTTFGLGHQACADFVWACIVRTCILGNFPTADAVLPRWTRSPHCTFSLLAGQTLWTDRPLGPAVAQPASKATHARVVIILMTGSPVRLTTKNIRQIKRLYHHAICRG